MFARFSFWLGVGFIVLGLGLGVFSWLVFGVGWEQLKYLLVCPGAGVVLVVLGVGSPGFGWRGDED